MELLEEEEEVNGKVEAEAEAERKVKEEAVAAKAAAAVEKVTEFALCAASVVILPLNAGSTMGTVKDVPSPPAVTTQAEAVAKAVEKEKGKAKAVKVVAKAKVAKAKAKVKVATEAVIKGVADHAVRTAKELRRRKHHAPVVALYVVAITVHQIALRRSPASVIAKKPASITTR